MANKVTAVVLGGQPVLKDGVSTVGELVAMLNLSLSSSQAILVNGNDANQETELRDFDFVDFVGGKVQGGL